MPSPVVSPEGAISPRIFGLEHELGMLVKWARKGKYPNPEDLAEALFAPLGGRHRFLRNGGRFYLDYGQHPEHATPECQRLRDLVTHDKAGERIFDGLGLELEGKLSRFDNPAAVYLFKNNTDSRGQTYGGHENYFTWLSPPLPELADALAPFLLTRQLLVGAGKLLRTNNRETVYALSQRAPFIDYPFSSGTTGHRGAISDRDSEPHADQSKHRRLHVILGDSNMSETTTMLKVGSTDLILRMIEDGGHLDDLRLSSADGLYRKAIRAASLDRSGQSLVWLADGRTITALALQQEYLMRAQRFAESSGCVADPETAAVLELWGRVLRAIEQDNLSLIDRHIDWAIKLRLLTDFCNRHDTSLSDPRCANIDLRYADLRPGRGLYQLMVERGQLARFTTDEAIGKAISTPPSDTRAALRGQVLEWGEAKRATVHVGWTRVTVEAPRATSTGARMSAAPTRAGQAAKAPKPELWTVTINDPYAAKDPEVDALLRRAEAASCRPQPPKPANAIRVARPPAPRPTPTP